MKVGPYSVIDTIGQGGAGVVFRARGPDGRLVAVKVLRRTDEAALRRFDREVRLQSGLGAPSGFVPVLDSGTVQGSPFLVLPFLEGGTLRDRLKKGPLGFAETIALGRTLARALGQAHALGIVHRDVKPENVLYTGDGAPLVADLGLAKHFDDSAPGASQSASISRHGALQGTIGYMAPEQAKNAKSAGPAADVFALGALLYECLSGRPAFSGDSLVEVIGHVISGEYPPLESLRPDVPRPLAKVVKRALAVDARARFADGLALERALAALPAAGGAAPRSRRALVALALVAPSLAVGVGIGKLRAPAPPAASPPPVAPAADTARVADLWRRAYECILAEDGTGARAFADELVALDGKSARAHALRAAAFERQQDLDAAKAEADAALALDARCSLALCVRACNATKAEAVALASKAIAADPDAALPYAYRAMQRIGDGDRDGARRDATHALELEPRCARAWMLRAALLEGEGDDDGCVRDATRALRHAPGVASLWQVRALAHAHLEQYDDAIIDATKALGIDERVADTWYIRASARLAKGEPGAAAADASRALELVPELASAWEVRAQARLALKESEGALADATRALELQPARVEAQRVQGAARDALGAAASSDWSASLRMASEGLAEQDYEKTIRHATDALRLAPTVTVIWCMRSTARCFTKDFAGAERDAAQAVDLEPWNAGALVSRSLARRERGDIDGAIADATKAIDLEPDRASHWTLRAEAKSRKDDKQGALADAARAVWLGPAERGSWITLSGALANAGQTEAARAAAKIALGQ